MQCLGNKQGDVVDENKKERNNTHGWRARATATARAKGKIHDRMPLVTVSLIYEWNAEIMVPDKYMFVIKLKHRIPNGSGRGWLAGSSSGWRTTRNGRYRMKIEWNGLEAKTYRKTKRKKNTRQCLYWQEEFIGLEERRPTSAGLNRNNRNNRNNGHACGVFMFSTFLSYFGRLSIEVAFRLWRY